MKTIQKPKVQFARKLGHLFQVLYGFPGYGFYGYGTTRKLASLNARLAFAQKGKP
jgi:hypothetical protein